jgi:hypothetical protein
MSNLSIRAGNVTTTVTVSVAEELIARADIPKDHDGLWRLPNDGSTTDINAALRSALVILTED